MTSVEQGYQDGLLDRGWNALELSGRNRDAYTKGWNRGMLDRASIQHGN